MISRGMRLEDVMLAGHPEHYSIHDKPGSNVNFVETAGANVGSFFMGSYADSVITDDGL